MIKALVILGGIVAALLAGVAIFAATKPDTFRVQRSITIQAPPEKVFPHIVDLKGWSAWSPWEKKDPAMKRTFGAVTSGKGAVYEWSGDKNVGKGRMEITDAAAPARIVIKLDFLEPFEAHNTSEFALAAGAGGTTVTWAMHGPATFLSKVMDVVFNMDRMVGADFEAGLASLKALAEK